MFVYISVTLGDAPQFSTFFISSKVRLDLPLKFGIGISVVFGHLNIPLVSVEVKY